MRLVLLYLGRRGAGPVYSIEFAQALLEKQVPILAIVSNYSGNINEWMLLSRKFRNLSLVTIDTYTNKKDFVIRSLNICLFAKLVRIIRKYSPDYVFTPMIHPWHNLVISLLPRKIKIIKVIHDVAPHLGESNLFSMLMNKADIFFSDRLVVLSQHSRKELEKAGIKKNICIIPHANFSYYSKYNDLATERKIYNLKSATKLFSVLLASKRPLITELADKLRLKYPLLPTISPCPTMRLEAIRSIIPISCRRYPKSV